MSERARERDFSAGREVHESFSSDSVGSSRLVTVTGSFSSHRFSGVIKGLHVLPLSQDSHNACHAQPFTRKEHQMKFSLKSEGCSTGQALVSRSCSGVSWILPIHHRFVYNL